MNYYYIVSARAYGLVKITQYEPDFGSDYIVTKIINLRDAFRSIKSDMWVPADLIILLSLIEQTTSIFSPNRQMHFLSSMGYEKTYVINILSILFPIDDLYLTSDEKHSLAKYKGEVEPFNLLDIYNKMLHNIKNDIKWNTAMSNWNNWVKNRK